MKGSTGVCEKKVRRPFKARSCLPPLAPHFNVEAFLGQPRLRKLDFYFASACAPWSEPSTLRWGGEGVGESRDVSQDGLFFANTGTSLHASLPPFRVITYSVLPCPLQAQCPPPCPILSFRCSLSLCFSCSFSVSFSFPFSSFFFIFFSPALPLCPSLVASICLSVPHRA